MFQISFLLFNLIMALMHAYRSCWFAKYLCETQKRNMPFVTWVSFIFHLPTISMMKWCIDFKRPHLIIKIAILTSGIIGEYKKKIYCRNIFWKVISTLIHNIIQYTKTCWYQPPTVSFFLPSHLFFLYFVWKFSRIRSSCPSYYNSVPYMFIVRYWMSKCKIF